MRGWVWYERQNEDEEAGSREEADASQWTFLLRSRSYTEAEAYGQVRLLHLAANRPDQAFIPPLLTD